jgi:hypothetical protein
MDYIPMDYLDSFRRHADECRAMAQSTRDPASRATWNNLAERWRHCAEIAESAMAKVVSAKGSARTRIMKQWSGSDAH